MTRIVVFLVFVGALALGAAWIADRPGEIVMTWQNWRVSTSVTVAVIAFLVALFLAILIWTLIRFVIKSPDLVSLFFRERRKTRGWRAITHGMIAIGSGNLALARRSTAEAQKLIGHEPLTLLLAAQTAQLGGDIEKAETEFRAMLGRAETKLLGLRGLFVEAMRRNDGTAAHTYALEASQSSSMPAWASEALIEFQSRAGDWASALKTLEKSVAAKAIDKATALRQRAVLLTAHALTVEETDPKLARELSVEAAKIDPHLVPAASLAGRLLGSSGSLRKAARIVEKAWAAMPHPDLAEVYAHLQPGDGGEERLKRVKKLVKKTRDHTESQLAVARASLEAKRFDEAREILVPILGDPTQRACLLMAEIEAAEHGDHGKAREWTTRALRGKRDPAWIADGFVSDRWLPASPHSGHLDVFEWRVPHAASIGPVLEQAAEQALRAPVIPIETKREEKPDPEQRRSISVAPKKKAAKRPETVAPFVAEPPLPDDPGPDVEQPNPPRRFRFLDWFAGPAA